jgi:hypothetical protein
MTPDRLFDVFSTIVLVGWLALILAPLRRELAVSVARWVAVILSGGYFAMLAAGLAGPGPPPGASFDSLAGVRLLLSTPEALLAGWVHYLAFDLFVGSWQVEDAPPPHAALAVAALPGADLLVAGPVGLLLYFASRLRGGDKAVRPRHILSMTVAVTVPSPCINVCRIDRRSRLVRRLPAHGRRNHPLAAGE